MVRLFGLSVACRWCSGLPVGVVLLLNGPDDVVGDLELYGFPGSGEVVGDGLTSGEECDASLEPLDGCLGFREVGTSGECSASECEVFVCLVEWVGGHAFPFRLTAGGRPTVGRFLNRGRSLAW